MTKKLAELHSIKIYTLTNLLVAKSNLKNNRGFSLIEIIIVIMIIGGVLAASLSRMSFKKVDNRTVFRGIVIAVKEVRNRAKLYGTTYRLAFKIDEKSSSYWLEKSVSPTLIDKEFLAKQRERGDKKDDDKAPPSPFQVDSSYSKKEKQLESGYTIKQLESGPQDAVFTEGTAYIHFFPTGMVEPVALQIQDPKKNIWTLVFNPLTGQADIIDGAKSLKDLSRQ
ncbi:prepilin-type cleavage/methylation domain-containing protein [Bdellovibrio sp. qaytius]|nr:prepilin-type cleavage/methylation domain-containing protein [Bdellovibrio sp. qaytius]